MPKYEAYPKAKDTPNRLTRKQARRKTFLKNKKLTAQAQKERRLARKAAEAVAAELAGE